MTKPIAWSYSALNAFETCPRQFYEVRVVKNYKDEMGEEAKWGDYVHKCLDKRIGEGKRLPDALQKYEKYAQRFDNAPGTVYSERKIALTQDLEPVSFFDKRVWVRGIIDVSVLNKQRGAAWDWKGLALDTPLPTPNGWTTMGGIEVGQQLFASDGSVCNVVAKSEVHYRPCYELYFDDGTKVVCDDEHLWVMCGKVVSTQYIAEQYPKERRGGRSKFSVHLTQPLSLDTKELPVDPYVLGCWLGDGRNRGGEITNPDKEVWDEIRDRGYNVGPDIGGKDRCETRTIYGLTADLRKLGVINNKHIPYMYLRASYKQRADLLRGLLDTDGSANSVRKQAVFYTCNKVLSDGVMELALTLGMRPQQDIAKRFGFGLEVTDYPVAFKPINDFQPFLLPRKANKVSGWGNGRAWRRKLKSIRKVDTVPTQCIAVDSKDNTFLCTEKFLITHNTGKRKLDGRQLKLFAALMFALHPELEQVNTGYIWLKDTKMDKNMYLREHVPELWGTFTPAVARLERAHAENNWPPNPSGLCRKWCPVMSCEYNGRRNNNE